MKTKENFLQRNKKRLLLVVGIIVLAGMIINVVVQRKNDEAKRKMVQEGVSYLESLEEKDVSSINAEIKAIKKQNTKEALEEDENAVWSGYEDAVITGDSRAVGFSYYEFLPAERVLAKSGGRITDISSYIDALKNLNPGQVFLCYGLNDIQSAKPADYSAQCAAQIEVIKEALPECEVYVSSILPAIGAGLGVSANYSRMDEYNASLQQMCEENNYGFVDNTEIAQEHIDLYEADGLHVQKDFYRYWATNMLLGVDEE